MLQDLSFAVFTLNYLMLMLNIKLLAAQSKLIYYIYFSIGNKETFFSLKSYKIIIFKCYINSKLIIVINEAINSEQSQN